MPQSRPTAPVYPRRRERFAAGLGAPAVALLPALPAVAQPLPGTSPRTERDETMGHVTTRDGVEIFYKDWGPKDAQPLVFHHGWPLSADDWDTQMFYFLGKGYRVVAHDRRGHGR